MIYDFQIFFIDKCMFSQGIRWYSLGNLMTEILKVVEKCTIFQNKGYKGRPGVGNLTKNLLGWPGFDRFGEFALGNGNAWN